MLIAQTLDIRQFGDRIPDYDVVLAVLTAGLDHKTADAHCGELWYEDPQAVVTCGALGPATNLRVRHHRDDVKGADHAQDLTATPVALVLHVQTPLARARSEERRVGDG